jgi:hypothetical protein
MTRFMPNRPSEMWSFVVAIFAATIGCTVGTCVVVKMPMFSVACASPAAQV